MRPRETTRPAAVNLGRAFRPAVALATLLAAAGPSSVMGQQASAPDSVLVVPGPQYASPPGGQRWLLGNGYRDLWTAEVRVEVLDLRAFAGGLTPVMRVGGMQTLGLALKGADGRDYTFRSIDKTYSEEVIPSVFRGTFVEDIIQDQIAANFPGVQVVAAPIEEAAGVLAPPGPRLVVVPDDPTLGEFREMFAGVLGVIAEFPQPVSETNPGFREAIEILDAEDFWARRRAGPGSLPNTRSFLRARLLDLLFNDWDRHHSQWRWARFEGADLLEPIAEDRDQIFTDFEGVALDLARSQGAQFVKYSGEFEPFHRAIKNGWDVDRFLLTDIGREEWMGIASDLRSRLTDDVLGEGLERLPIEFREMRGDEVGTFLRQRRDQLVEMAGEYYTYLSSDVDVHASDADELITVEGSRGGGVEVSVAVMPESADSLPRPYFLRTFFPEETREVRIYLHGGEDKVVTMGDDPSGITIRVVGGPGTNTVDDSGGFAVRFYGSEGDNRVVGGNGTEVDPKPAVIPANDPPNDTPWVPARDWGGASKPLAVFGYQSDPGVILGGGIDTWSYGFRKYPWSSRHTLKAGLALGVMRPFADYKGRFRRENSAAGYIVEARVSGIDNLRYFGLGNETLGEGADETYRIKSYGGSVFLGVGASTGDEGTVAVGPVLRYTDSSGTDSATVLVREDPLGSGKFGQIGVRLSGRYDSRGQAAVLQPGFLIEGTGEYFLEAWDVEDPYGSVDAHVGAFLRLADPLLLSLHAVGRKNWGAFPFFDAASIGGQLYPMGTKWNRWSGESSLGGLAAIRWTLAKLRLLLPGSLGVFGMADAARVWVDGENSSQWHPSFGGGVFLVGLDRSGALHIGGGTSPDSGGFFIIRANFAGLDFQ